MSAYTTDTLLSDIRTAAMLPDASTATFSNADLLRILDREMQATVVPLVMSCRSEFFVIDVDQVVTTISGQSVSIQVPMPYRAIGGILRDVNWVDDQANYYNIPQLSLDDLHAKQTGFFVKGDYIQIFNQQGYWPYSKLRLTYFLRPNRLASYTTGTYAAAYVTSIDSTTQVHARIVTSSALPATFTTGLKYDFVKASPPFTTLAFDQTASVSGTTMTFTGGVPANLSVGDFICLAEESPVPQIPVEFHPFLTQRAVVKVLEALNDREGMATAQAKAQEMQQAVIDLAAHRVKGEPKRFANRSSPFRRQRRWFGVY